MKTLRAALAAFAALALLSCDDSDEVFEKIDKLRALGVSSSPLVSEPSTVDSPKSFALTFFIALPKGQSLAAVEPFLDEESRFAPPVLLAIDSASIIVEPHAAFDIVSVKGSLALPLAEALPMPPNQGFVRLRYGLRVVAGDEEEKIVGTLLVYPPGSPELAWNANLPQASVTSPTQDAAIGDGHELIGSIVNPIGESMRVAWFVSSGKLANRRARETKWRKPESGPQTLIFTIRGSKSGAFSYKVVDVQMP